MGVKFGIVTIGTLLVLAGCAEGHCRHPVSAPPEPKPVEAPPDGKVAAKPMTGENIFVFKYDGSLQCGMGKAVTTEVMQKDLKGIPVVSATKKNDGLMHIQVCGSLTGMANVFEIPAKFLKKAEAKGFKKWSFE